MLPRWLDQLNADDLYLMATCVYDEARGECFNGQRAVARVILNRTRLPYASLGTIFDTVLHRDQFSGFWFESRPAPGGKWKYTRVCDTQREAGLRAKDKEARAKQDTRAWERAMKACALEIHEERMGRFGDELLLTPDTVLYVNPTVLAKVPSWAASTKLVHKIGNHSFYRK